MSVLCQNPKRYKTAEEKVYELPPHRWHIELMKHNKMGKEMNEKRGYKLRLTLNFFLLEQSELSYPAVQSLFVPLKLGFIRLIRVYNAKCLEWRLYLFIKTKMKTKTGTIKKAKINKMKYIHTIWIKNTSKENPKKPFPPSMYHHEIHRKGGELTWWKDVLTRWPQFAS